MSTAAAFAALLEPSFLHPWDLPLNRKHFSKTQSPCTRAGGKAAPAGVGAQAQPRRSPIPHDIKLAGPVKGSEERDGQ